MIARYQTVLDFWFNTLTPAQWFAKSTQLDEQIREQFSALLQQASACELWQWRNEPRGRLAEIIVLDQFSRNIFRDTPRAFQQDSLGLALAQEAVALGADQTLTAVERSFLYMPYMHSESPSIHERAVELFNQPGLENNLDFEYKHKAIIDRFGRYPHRNAILDRTSSAEEIEFLKQPGSGF
ncbi:DUF924 family protein [Cellvibrio polysaccharolyticus]|uniref:DUF924 domain-containing protein n=1 Tax=Cellvibrio polysaccharolyticus TaxID=2082724 RepID=A0A928V2W2_9GAMM|nr:DUF924 family protein [Cellvibrio polysaccharolyticus]MBE8717781.1 DUF924 domain-containing protein [Cellvibrio polysaccharolyticus]